MAKVRTPNQKKSYGQLNKRLAGYVLLVEQIYDTLNLEMAKLALGAGYDGSKPFRFQDYPNTRDKVNRLKNQFVGELGAVIYSGTSDEWKRSNLMQDLLVDKVMQAYGVKKGKKKKKVYYQTNSDALKAFQERKDNGMNLSAKLWNQAANYKKEMEYAISSAVEKGTSAVKLSKRLSKYLQDFPKLQKDYKEKFGKAVDCHDCEYRSIRLARSEINMAYRTAEQTRWQQMDFIVGYEIKLSAKHPCHDVCDDLAGKYPKDFVWTGWHPNDMCYLVPILNTEEEFWSDSTTSVNEVKDVPEGFKKWVEENRDRLDKAKERGTLPYFVKDNKQYLGLDTPVKSARKIRTINEDEILKDYKSYPDFISEKSKELRKLSSQSDLSDGDFEKVLGGFKNDLDASFQEYVGREYTESFTVYDEQSYENVMDMLGNATKPVWSKASVESKQALVDYTGSDSMRILSDVGRGISNEKADRISEVLDGITTTESLVLRSGQRYEMLEYIWDKDFKNMLERRDIDGLNSMFGGRVGTNKSFMSTSFNENGGLDRDFEFHIFAPKGTHCMNLNEISEFGNMVSIHDWDGYEFSRRYDRSGETEILLHSGYRFKFIKAEKGAGKRGRDRIYVQLLNRKTM